MKGTNRQCFLWKQMKKSSLTSISRSLFFLAWFFVAFVEVYDVYWSIKLQDSLVANELNPIGSFLLSLDGGDVALFMAMKVSAIIMILGSLPVILSDKPRLAWILLGVIFVSRVALFAFLETGHLW